MTHREHTYLTEMGAQQAAEATVFPAYDTETDEEIPVAVAPGAQQWPAIHGDMVVWADNRNSPVMGTRIAGCHNCPDNRFDIYSYDLTTGEERPLVQGSLYNGTPSIHGQRVVWQSFRENGESEINLLNIGTGQRCTLGQAGRTDARPIVSGDFVVWTVREACDVIVIWDPPREVQTGVFAYNLKTDEVRQLSNYVETVAWLHDDVVLISEICSACSRGYAVFLNEAVQPFPSTQPPPDWRLVEAPGWESVPGFSLRLPAGWELNELQGIDSYVGEVVGDGVRLTFDYGAYSSSLSLGDDPEHTYAVTYEDIGGVEAKLVMPTGDSDGYTGVYFESLGGPKLNLVGKDLTPEQQETAFAIFRSIRVLGQ